MSKPYIFISCGQYTIAEKQLGKQIADMVRNLTDLEPFFAEEVQSLSGLDSSILRALHECVAFITVLHPRGAITRPNTSVHTRASVWIEQEIAIATYIQRVENRQLPIIAFKHVSVGREGIRDLLQLNPIEFNDESEVLALLPDRLAQWKSLKRSGIRLELMSIESRRLDEHTIRKLLVILVNDSNQRIGTFDCQILVPAGILEHWSSKYSVEAPNDDPRRRRFQINEKHNGSVDPHDTKLLFGIEYCTACAIASSGELALLVGQETVEAKIWIDGREYSDKKSLIELAGERDAKGNS